MYLFLVKLDALGISKAAFQFSDDGHEVMMMMGMKGSFLFGPSTFMKNLRPKSDNVLKAVLDSKLFGI